MSRPHIPLGFGDIVNWILQTSAGNGVIDKEELKLLLETVEDGFACPTTVRSLEPWNDYCSQLHLSSCTEAIEPWLNFVSERAHPAAMDPRPRGRQCHEPI